MTVQDGPKNCTRQDWWYNFTNIGRFNIKDFWQEDSLFNYALIAIKRFVSVENQLHGFHGKRPRSEPPRNAHSYRPISAVLLTELGLWLKLCTVYTIYGTRSMARIQRECVKKNVAQYCHATENHW